MPMLNMATNQMGLEIEELQSNNNNNIPRDDEDTSTTQEQTSHRPTRPTLQASSDESDNNDALENLKSMLMSLDIDERAKPAVMAYKQAVHRVDSSLCLF
jgi:hypothetical protein